MLKWTWFKKKKDDFKIIKSDSDQLARKPFFFSNCYTCSCCLQIKNSDIDKMEYESEYIAIQVDFVLFHDVVLNLQVVK